MIQTVTAVTTTVTGTRQYAILTVYEVMLVQWITRRSGLACLFFFKYSLGKDCERLRNRDNWARP